MLRKTVGVLLALLLSSTLLVTTSSAQEASPVSGDCPTADSVASAFFDAVVVGDLETADSLMRDDFVHDLSSDGVEVPNEPGNADELSQEGMGILAESDFVIDAMIAQDDWVAIEFSFSVSGANVQGADPEATATVEGMTFLRVECGEIAEAHFEYDTLGLLLQLGFEVEPPTAP